MVYLPGILNRYSPPCGRGSSSLRALLAVAAVLVVAGTVCAAPNDKSTASPDVLVLVLNGLGPFDQVSINYTSAIPDQDAKNDVAALARDTGWMVRNVEVTTKSVNRPGAKPTTAVMFKTPGIVKPQEGLLALEPFIAALKRFGSIQVNYLVYDSRFGFRGLRDFENRYVKIAMSQTGNSYVYRVRVKDKDFTRLKLPLRPEVEHVAAPRESTPVGARVMLVIGFALIGAVVAYFLVACISRSRRSDRRGDSNGA
ncbi:MAG: hypothetical protein M1133_02845 [Armatimonadetes bacterium]|nr:hypothetical protein [Armatimonadota bacterium]